MRPAGLHIHACGADLLWSGWSEAARVAGVHLTTGEILAVAGGFPQALLVGPGEDGPLEAVGRAIGLCGSEGGACDVWLVCAAAPPALRAAVLAIGGAGCLPRLPQPEWLERVRRLAAWRPVAADTRGPAEGVARSRGSGPGARAGGAAGGGWWQWPPPDPGSVRPTLAALAAGPRAAGQAEAVLSAWAGRRSAPVEAAADASPAPGQGRALFLGVPPPPRMGLLPAAVGIAARARAAVVLSSLELSELERAAALTSALVAAGSPEVRVWIVEGRPAPRLLRELTVACGAPCAAVRP